MPKPLLVIKKYSPLVGILLNIEVKNINKKERSLQQSAAEVHKSWEKLQQIIKKPDQQNVCFEQQQTVMMCKCVQMIIQQKYQINKMSQQLQGLKHLKYQPWPQNKIVGKSNKRLLKH